MPEIEVSDALYRQLRSTTMEPEFETVLWKMVHHRQRMQTE